MDRTLPASTWRPVAWTISLLAGLALLAIPVTGLLHWPPMSDTTVYWDAAGRILGGAPLYAPGDSPFLYPPWFAWLWIPLRTLPFPIVAALWSLALLGAWMTVAWRARHSVLMPLLAGCLLTAVWVGNVHPLIVLALASTRHAPWAIAVTGSLKGGPLAYALSDLRQPRRLIIIVALTAALVAPIVLYNVAAYPIGSARADPVPGWPLFALVGVLLALAGTRTRYREWALAVAVIVIQPRPILYDFGFLLIPLALGTTPLRARLGMPTRSQPAPVQPR